MKNFLIIFCSCSLVLTTTLFAYNSNKGAAQETEGITELPQTANDSLLQHGKYLVEKMKYSEEDLKAVAFYLNSR